MIELFGVSGKLLITIGIVYIITSKIFLFISWYILLQKLPDSIIKQDYKKISHHMNTFRIMALYEVIITLIYLIIGIAIIEII